LRTKDTKDTKDTKLIIAGEKSIQPK